MTTTRLSSPSALSQWVSLARAEFTLLRRNALQLFYAFLMPLLSPLLFRPLAEIDGVDGILATTVALIVVIGLIFVSYYNPLSAVVTRREESVLLRLRAGEVSDKTILAAIATPGVVLGFVMAAATLAISIPILNLPVPTNIPLILVTIGLTILMFVALAYATSVFTRTAESAQITSMPIILLASLGTAVPLLPDSSSLISQIAQYLPTAPVAELLMAGWFGPVIVGELWQPALIMVAWITLAWAYVGRKFRWAKRV